MYSGNGTYQSPFSSISEATAAISALNENSLYPKDGVTVKIRKGTYEVNNAISLDASTSGKNSAPVKFEAYEDEKVVLTTSKSFLLSEFDIADDERIDESLKGKIYSIDLSGCEIEGLGDYNVTGHSKTYLDSFNLIEENGYSLPIILNNDKQMVNARYPNGDYMAVGKVIQNSDIIRNWMDDKIGTSDYVEEKDRNNPPKTMVFEVSESEERLTKWKNASDAWVLGYWYYDWSDQTTPIASVDIENKTITTKYPSAYGVRKDQRFYIYNLLEELDVPGEWYYDKNLSTLYVYPADTSDNAKISITYPISEAIKIENAKNIIIDGIDISGSGGRGINIANSSNITVRNCSVKNVSNVGITVAGGNNVLISNNKISKTGLKGISVSGGDYQTLTPCGHIVENNDISDFGRTVKTYESGISVSGVGITARNNLIYNGPHAGMIVGGNDCIIENNEIHSVLKEAADMGAIYSGRSMVRRGNKFIGNIIHDCDTTSTAGHGITAIYFDDQLCGQTVEDNIIYNFDGVGVFINGGRDNNVWNNTFSNLSGCGVSLNCAGRAKNWESEVNFEERLGLTSVPYQSEAYSKYPHLSDILEDEPMTPKYNVVKENKYYNVADEININLLTQYGSDMTMEEFLSLNTIVDGTELENPYAP